MTDDRRSASRARKATHVPASRSRTERWKDSLHQIAARQGGIEFAIDRDTASPGVMWRVRLLSLTDSELIIEQPAAAGQPVIIPEGTEITVVIAIGQNRWTFPSRVMGRRPFIAGRHPAIALRMPEGVERCARREFARAATGSFALPKVECFPLLNPTSVVDAELANRALICELARTNSPWTDAKPLILPEVGPSFAAQMLNIGGGGLGLLVDRGETSHLGRSPLLWMRVDLRPEIAAPLGITGRVAHTHLDHEQRLHLGLAFDFSFHPGHKEFVIGQITGYVNRLTGGARNAA